LIGSFGDRLRLPNIFELIKKDRPKALEDVAVSGALRRLLGPGARL
jgi:hypothetical protein